MNYRHIYHAANICDVVKHAVLILLIEQLRAKEKPFGILDTHAGIGLYDLHDPRAQKTNEAQAGVYQLLAATPLPQLSVYYEVLRKLNPEGDIHVYPGSPLLAAHLLRPKDRLIACELHGEDIEDLRRAMRGFDNVQVHHRDGYEALKAFLPLQEKRGLVFIDPPYEQTSEFDRLVAEVVEAYQQWPQGLFAVWYPVKERPAVWRFHEALIATDIPNQLCAEFIYQEETRHDRLNGCGFIFINPPWQFDQRLAALFPDLHRALVTPHQGVTVNWLAKEKA